MSDAESSDSRPACSESPDGMSGSPCTSISGGVSSPELAQARTSHSNRSVVKIFFFCMRYMTSGFIFICSFIRGQSLYIISAMFMKYVCNDRFSNTMRCYRYELVAVLKYSIKNIRVFSTL